MTEYIKEQLEGTFEYMNSIKILNRLASNMFNEINAVILEIEEVIDAQISKEQSVMKIQFKSNFLDLLNLREQSISQIKKDDVDKELIVELIVSVVGLIGEMINDINQLLSQIDQLQMTDRNKLILAYKFDYLKVLLKNIIK